MYIYNSRYMYVSGLHNITKIYIYVSSGTKFFTRFIRYDAKKKMEKKKEFSFFLIFNFRLDILPLTVLLFCHIDHNWFWWLRSLTAKQSIGIPTRICGFMYYFHYVRFGYYRCSAQLDGAQINDNEYKGRKTWWSLGHKG